MIVGLIIDMEEAFKKINVHRKLPYYVMKIRSGGKVYSALLSQSSINKFGFLPRMGQRVEVKGSVYKTAWEDVDFVMKRITSFVHLPTKSDASRNVAIIEKNFRLVKRPRK